MTKTIEKLLLAMAFAGFMGAAFGTAFSLALMAGVEDSEEGEAGGAE